MNLSGVFPCRAHFLLSAFKTENKKQIQKFFDDTTYLLLKAVFFLIAHQCFPSCIIILMQSVAIYDFPCLPADLLITIMKYFTQSLTLIP